MPESGMTFEEVSKHRNTKNKEMPESGMSQNTETKTKTRNA